LICEERCILLQRNVHNWILKTDERYYDESRKEPEAGKRASCKLPLASLGVGQRSKITRKGRGRW
jgi:hypothetical protein